MALEVDGLGARALRRDRALDQHIAADRAGRRRPYGRAAVADVGDGARVDDAARGGRPVGRRAGRQRRLDGDRRGGVALHRDGAGVDDVSRQARADQVNAETAGAGRRRERGLVEAVAVGGRGEALVVDDRARVGERARQLSARDAEPNRVDVVHAGDADRAGIGDAVVAVQRHRGRGGAGADRACDVEVGRAGGGGGGGGDVVAARHGDLRQGGAAGDREAERRQRDGGDETFTHSGESARRSKILVVQTAVAFCRPLAIASSRQTMAMRFAAGRALLAVTS